MVDVPGAAVAAVLSGVQPPEPRQEKLSRSRDNNVLSCPTSSSDQSMRLWANISVVRRVSSASSSSPAGVSRRMRDRLSAGSWNRSIQPFSTACVT